MILIMRPGEKLSCLDVPLIDMRPLIRPNVGADHTASGADHPATQRPYRRFVGQPISVHGRAVVALAGIAIDQKVSASMGPDVRHGHWRKAVSFAWCHSSSSAIASSIVNRRQTPRFYTGAESVRTLDFSITASRRPGGLCPLLGRRGHTVAKICEPVSRLMT
jgi:hypothetical protein